MMRLWSLHPKYLDAKGLVALWREALLAQNVLLGLTKGYKNHPQLNRFKEQRDPGAAIGSYLEAVYIEACSRDYHFDSSKIRRKQRSLKQIYVNSEQKKFEFQHLLGKLKQRSRDDYQRLKDIKRIQLHPSFKQKPGPIEDWEIQ